MTGLLFAVIHVVGDDRARLSPRGEVEIPAASDAARRRPTARQLEVLRAVARHHGHRPTIAKALGVASVKPFLLSLEARGYVRCPFGSHGVSLTAAGWEAIS